MTTVIPTSEPATYDELDIRKWLELIAPRLSKAQVEQIAGVWATSREIDPDERPDGEVIEVDVIGCRAETKDAVTVYGIEVRLDVVGDAAAVRFPRGAAVTRWA